MCNVIIPKWIGKYSLMATRLVLHWYGGPFYNYRLHCVISSTNRCISSLDNPPLSFITLMSVIVVESTADTLRMPSLSSSNSTWSWGTPRGAGAMSMSSKQPRRLLSLVIDLSPSKTLTQESRWKVKRKSFFFFFKFPRVHTRAHSIKSLLAIHECGTRKHNIEITFNGSQSLRYKDRNLRIMCWTTFLFLRQRLTRSLRFLTQPRKWNFTPVIHTARVRWDKDYIPFAFCEFHTPCRFNQTNKNHLSYTRKKKDKMFLCITTTYHVISLERVTERNQEHRPVSVVRRQGNGGYTFLKYAFFFTFSF